MIAFDTVLESRSVNRGPVAATRQGACGFGVETLAFTKNACDAVVAAFFEVYPDRYRDAFHTKARSPYLITTTCVWTA